MKKFLILLLLILNLVSCNGNSQNNIATDSPDKIDTNSDIKTLYKQGKYYSISKQPNKISDETDTALFIVASSKIKNFKAIEPYNKELKKYIYIKLLNTYWPDTAGMSTEDFKKLIFPYKVHTSMELFYMGHYFLSKDSISKESQYRYLLQESLLKDSKNLFALYDFAKELISSREYQGAEVILKKILEIDPNWERAKQMFSYNREQLQKYNLKSLKVNVLDVVNFGIPYEAYDPNFEKF